MASLADALEFLKQGFNGQGAITQYGDGFSSPQTNNINEFGPIPQKQAPVIVIDPSSMPIDLRDFTGGGSVDRDAITTQDNMQPIDRVAAGVKTGDTPAQAISKTAKARAAIGTEDFTKEVVNNPKPAVPTKAADMINLDPYGYGTSAAPASDPITAEQIAAAASNFAEDAPMKVQPQTAQSAQQNMAFAEDAPQVKYAPNTLIDNGKLSGPGAALGSALLGALMFAASRGRVKPNQTGKVTNKPNTTTGLANPKFLQELATPRSY